MTELAKALLATQKAMPAIHKDSKAEVPTKSGGKFSYTYLSLQGLLEIVLPVLNNNGLALSQIPAIDPVSGKQILRTTLFHESGESLVGESPLIVSGNETPQSWGGAVTYARRYALTALLGIAADEDDDGAAASKPRAAVKSASRLKTPDSVAGIDLSKVAEINALTIEYAATLGKPRGTVLQKLTEKFPDWRVDTKDADKAVTHLKSLLAANTAGVS